MTSSTEEKLQSGDMGVECFSCGGRSFRRSRLQMKDMWSLLVLRYPVRCLSCSIRQTVGLTVAARAVSSKVKQVRASQSATALSGWGATDAPATRVRPSTVGGSGSWTMPVRETMTMPDLHGVTIQHTTSLPSSDENPMQ